MTRTSDLSRPIRAAAPKRPVPTLRPHRRDIQGLRGLAVTLVVLGHAGLPWLARRLRRCRRLLRHLRLRHHLRPAAGGRAERFRVLAAVLRRTRVAHPPGGVPGLRLHPGRLLGSSPRRSATRSSCTTRWRAACTS
ncbi:hypothetical protein R2F25_34965 [Streptomyces sp. UP1A-1]|nr:hypothetical protein [Streptomyces sp. UP1A-1]